MKYSYINKRTDILFLVKLGFPILEVEIDDSCAYFFTNNFEAPNLSNLQSAPYLTFKGLDITAFLENSIYSLNSESLYKERFLSLLSKDENINYKFSDKHIWRYFS